MGKSTLDRTILQSIKSFVSQVSRQYNLEHAILFGSQVTGKAKRNSDIDICLVSQDFPKDLFDAKLQLQKLSQNYDSRIEVHLLLPEDYNNRYYTFAKEVKSRGIAIN